MALHRNICCPHEQSKQPPVHSHSHSTASTTCHQQHLSLFACTCRPTPGYSQNAPRQAQHARTPAYAGIPIRGFAQASGPIGSLLSVEALPRPVARLAAC